MPTDDDTSPRTVGEMTVDELRHLLDEVIEEALRQYLDDPDDGLELRQEVAEQLERQLAEVEAGRRGVPLDDITSDDEIREPVPEYLRPKSDDEVDEILTRLRDGLEDLYGDRLRGLYLYGSYARGEAVSGSDLDVLVVLDDFESSWKEIERTSELTADLSLEYNVTIAKIFTREARWRNGDTPFLANVRREGVTT